MSVSPSCPDCSKPMILRRGKFGEFYGCSGFPKCRKTVQPGKINQASAQRKFTPKGNVAAAGGSPFGTIKARTDDNLKPGTPQQEAIWALLESGLEGSHICVDAGPGTGKTFCGVQGILRLDPELNIGVAAFNRHIRS